MGRPKRVIFENFKDYNLLHTEKTKMMSGVSLTTLYPIKEVKQFYRSIEVWAYCASTFRRKKENVQLKVEIPIITDEATIAFLEKHNSKRWLEKNKSTTDSEAISLLNALYPDKEVKYFYEFDSIISAYVHGNFESFDDNGNLEPLDKNDIKMQKYYCHKYNNFLLKVPEIKELFDKYSAEENKDKKQKLFNEYHSSEEEYAFKNFNLVKEFTEIGRNAVCYPVAFSDGTADWYMEKYGKPCSYAHAGEIFFVVTEKAIYFEVKRHF